MNVRRDDSAVSPVVAVILMVAITVILSAAVGALVFNLGQSTDDATTSAAGVAIDENDDGTVTVQLHTKGGSDSVIVRNSLGAEHTLTDVGDSTTITPNGDAVTVLSESDGKRTVVQTYDRSTSFSHIGIVDSAEDSDLSEYTSSSSFTVSTDTASDGTLSIKGARASQGSFGGIESYSGLSRYPKAGDTFEYRVNLSTYNHAKFSFGRQANDTGLYVVTVRKAFSTSSKLRIAKVDNEGNFEIVNETTTTIPNREWIRIRVKWTKTGNINTTAFDASNTKIATVTATDSNFTKGGILFDGYDENGGNPVYWDDVKIIASND